LDWIAKMMVGKWPFPILNEGWEEEAAAEAGVEGFSGRMGRICCGRRPKHKAIRKLSTRTRDSVFLRKGRVLTYLCGGLRLQFL
jgi:hypothetical protein